MARKSGNKPYNPNTPANTDTIIHRAINGDEVPPVLRISMAEVAHKIAKAVSDPQKIYFLGAHKYETNPAASAKPAIIAAVLFTSNAESILPTSAKYAQK